MLVLGNISNFCLVVAQHTGRFWCLALTQHRICTTKIDEALKELLDSKTFKKEVTPQRGLIP
jgi:hypothetical protein